MEASFWLSRWEQNQTGFHETEVHSDLLEFGENWLSAASGGPKKDILVPLCGKTKDLVHLAKLGHSVVGVELSELAAAAVFNEAKLAFTQTKQGPFQVFRAQDLDLEVRVGNFFKLPAKPSFDAVWDRAAMVALDPERRARYAEHLIQLVRPGGAMLVNIMEYPQEQMPGPPHAISFDDLGAVYGAHFKLELLKEEDEIDHLPKFRERGLDRFLVATSLLIRD
ncbi:MAG: thiopurine S-methyltransferase [Cognaticolwellia sp.]|jgi:thiopurine S-methyltransferase